MSYWLNERVVIKYDAEEPRIVDAIRDVLEKEGFGGTDLILEVGRSSSPSMKKLRRLSLSRI